MIEKITKEEIESVWMEPVAGNIQSIYGKVNELIDAVNTIQKEREAERFEIQEWIAILEAVRESVNIHGKQIDELQMNVEPAENWKCAKNAQEPYAEQRRWIGKLCRFWDSVYDSYYFDTLKGIIDEGLFIGHNGVWKHCEPVKPDDDIIYKGGKDE